MRTMQIAPFKKFPIDWKFFIGRVEDPSVKEGIDKEIEEYNDIILLPNLTEHIMIAITRKFFEVLKYVETDMSGYDLVCKIDGDTFLNVPNLWSQYLEPNLEMAQQAQPTLIGRIWDYVEEGAFYQPKQPHINIAFVALNKKLLYLVNRLYDIHFREAKNWTDFSVYISDEINLSHFLKEDIISYNLIALPHNTSSHFNPNETNMSKLAHVIVPECIYVHELKKEQEYVQVSSCFNETGLDIDKANKVLNQAYPLK
jgi:hypothetical protein